MKNVFALFCLISGCVSAQSQSPVPAVAAGRIERWHDFQSRNVSPRNIDVWLPPGYDGRSRCQVIYMHDGQMLFDASTTWNKKAWGMADTVALLIRDGKMPGTIIVGIWSNGPQRHSEYFPEKALQFMVEPLRTQFVARALGGRPQADNYLRFLVQELKPEIDRKYATRPEREHTIIMGSSMGGIISLYAICEYPDIFGAAGCLSTHWLGSFEKNATIPLATFDYLKEHLPDPKSHRIYCDHGTETLDSLYAESQAFADVLFREKGYKDENYQSRIFPGAAHTEDAWAQRVAIPLVFLSTR
jgi:predicted alpha/beta superfamily hydrolase